MKVTLIHGENTPVSREKFRELKEKARTRGWVVQKMHFPPSFDLFEKKVLYEIDGFSKLEPSKVDWIGKKSAKYDGYLLIYEGRELPEKVVASLGKDIKVEKFDIPKTIFKFLESFYPGNAKTCLRCLHELIDCEPIEFVFSLLVRQIRDLFWVSVSTNGPNYPDWRTKRLRTQANKFGGKKLIGIINSLALLDVNAKTSASELLSSLDLLILKKLR